MNDAMTKVEDSVLAQIADDLFSTSEVAISHAFRYGTLVVVAYTNVASGQLRLAIYDTSDGLESIADLVADEE